MSESRPEDWMCEHGMRATCIYCNSDRAEPQTSKERSLLDLRPHGSNCRCPTCVGLEWAHEQIERLQEAVSTWESTYRYECSQVERLREALELIRDYPPRVLDADRVEDMKELASHALGDALRTCLNLMKGHAGDPCPVCGNGPCKVLADEPESSNG